MDKKKAIWLRFQEEIDGLSRLVENGSDNYSEIVHSKLNEWKSIVGQIQEEENNAHDLFELRERKRELECLYAIMESLQTYQDDEEMTQALTKVVSLVSSGFMVPEEICVELTVGADVFYSDKNKPLEGVQIRRETESAKGTRVVLQVCRCMHDTFEENDKESFEQKQKRQAFLKEEHELIKKIEHVIIQSLNNHETLKALVDSKERYRTTIYSIGDAVITSDAKGIIQQLNPVAEKLTGWSEKEAIGKPVQHVFKIINEYSRNQVEDPVKKVLRNGQAVQLANHTLLITKDGREIPITDSVAPIIDKANKVQGVVLVFRDQRNERESLKELEESEKKFRTMVEKSPEPIFIQTEHKFVYVNALAQKLYGATSPDQLLGMPIANRVHPDFHNIIRNRIYRLNKKKETVSDRSEQIHFKLDGTPFWVETSGTPVNYEGKAGGLVFIRDISDRKKAEEKLIESESRYRTIFQNHHTVMLIMDPMDGRILDANQAAESYYGWNKEELLHMSNYEIICLSKDAIEKEMEKALNKEQKAFQFQHRKKDGSVRDVDVYSGPISLLGKNVLFSIVVDVTKRVTYEKMVQESLREKEAMLSEIHHRVKNNLAVISGLLSLEAEMCNNPELTERLLKSDNRIRSMALIHEKLYEKGTFSQIDLSEYVYELVSNIERLFDLDDSVEKYLDIEPVKLDMFAAVPCGIILNEILTNGYKYGRTGSPKSVFNLEISQKNDEVSIIYRDNGKGFDKAIIENFELGQFSTLGFQLVSGLVKQLKGNLCIENKNGARVVVTFPLINK